jgi:hypothetical protein
MTANAPFALPAYRGEQKITQTRVLRPAWRAQWWAPHCF